MSTRIVRKSIYRIFVLRVSGKGDRKGSINQFDVLRGYTHVPGVQWLVDHFDIAIMSASSTSGGQLRATWQRDHGLEVLRRRGRQDFLGVTLVVDGTRFVIYASTAAILDEKDSNAFTRHLCHFISEDAFTGHADPDFQRRRDAQEPNQVEHPSVINAFDATRFVRRLDTAMELWRAASMARAVFDVKDVRVDPEAGEHQQMMWTFLAYGSEMESTVGKIRRFVGRLNKARAGYFPYADSYLPLGFATSGKDFRTLAPEPAQQAAVAALHSLHSAGMSWQETAECLGTTYGVLSTDPKTAGTPLHKLHHPETATRRLYLTRKLLAYRDQELQLRFVGVVPNRLNPGAGHILQRRWYGRNAAGDHDEYGAITYSIPAPAPTVNDHLGNPRPGWLPGLSAEAEHAAWTKLIEAVGWREDDDSPNDRPASAGTTSERTTPAARSGAAGYGNTPMMALARLCRFRDDEAGEHGPRTILEPRAPSATRDACGRYELRRELQPPTREGIGKTGPAIASWTDHALRGHLADLLLQIWERLEHQGHELGLLRAEAPRLAKALTSQEDQDKIDQLTAKADEADDLAKGMDLLAAQDALDHQAAKDAGDTDSAAEHAENMAQHREQARNHKRAAKQYRTAVAKLKVNAVAANAPAADLGTARDIIAALKGPYRCGQVPPAFTTALRDLLPEGFRFEPGPDPSTIWLITTAEFPLTDGTTIRATDRALIPHEAGRRSRQGINPRLEDSCRRYMCEGVDIATIAADLGTKSTEQALRVIREFMLSGRRRDNNQLDTTTMDRRMPNVALRPLPFTTPIIETRAILWHHWTGTPGKPSGVTPAFAKHIVHTYTSPSTGPESASTRKQWAWESNIDLRCDFLTVLQALPQGSRSMRADFLAQQTVTAGNDAHHVRLLLDASTDLLRNGNTYPATLRRIPAPGHTDGWGGHAAAHLDPADKLISPVLCPHPCTETYATAIVFAPEVLAFGTALLCKRCRRPAVDTSEARRTVFPKSYITWALSQPQRRGHWVSCHGHHCTKDVGAGPGLTWRWHDTPKSTGSWHDDECRIGSAPSRYRPCGYQDCRIDEGGGPGQVRLHQPARRWHGTGCVHAEKRRQRQAARTTLFTSCAWSECQLDEGDGPGSIAGGDWRRKTHDDPRCRSGARRERTARRPK